MDLNYAAGFFDGEGCVRIDKLIIPPNRRRPSGYMRYQLKVSIAQANPDPLYLFQAQFGGSLCSDGYAKKLRSQSRIRNQWVAWSRYAYDFLVAVRPFLIVKAEEANLAISMFEEMDANRTHFKKHRGNPPDKLEILASRDAICSKLSALKRRDFPPITNGPIAVSAA